MITVIKEFSTATTGDTFTSQLQSGDVILFIASIVDSADYDGPYEGEEGTILSISPAAGGDPIAWTLTPIPGGVTQWRTPNHVVAYVGDYDTAAETYYGCPIFFWPVEDVPAGNYELTFDLAASAGAGDVENVTVYVAILLNVDSAN